MEDRKVLSAMVPTNETSREVAMKNQEDFAREWSIEINNSFGFGDESAIKDNKVAIDINELHNSIRTGRLTSEVLVQMTPTKPEIYEGDIVGDIFTVDMRNPGEVAEYPIEDTSDSDDWTAISIPDDGALPERLATTDSTWVRCYSIGNSAFWKSRFAIAGNSISINKARNRFNNGFVKKVNDAGWHAILGAGADRNVVVVNSSASSGAFTKGLITSMSRQMARLGGGNHSSQKKFRLTDLYVSLEAMEDILLWGPSDVGDGIVTDLMRRGYDTINFYGINIHIMYEFGADQEYDDYLQTDLGASLPTGRHEFVIGLDKSKTDTFVMPVDEPISIFPDETAIRRQRVGFWGKMSFGAAVLDSRAVLLGAF